MDLTDPRFVQAFMKSKEGKTENIPTLFNPMIQTSKTMKTVYDSEKAYLESKFENKVIPEYLDYTMRFHQSKTQEKANAIKEEIWTWLERLSEYEIRLIMRYYEKIFFGLRMDAIKKTIQNHPNVEKKDQRALMKREIFIQQAMLLKDMMQFGIPLSNKLKKYIDDNLFIFADIFSRNQENLITNYDLNVYTYPLDKYRGYYYRLFELDLPFYDQDKVENLRTIQTYLMN